MLHSFLGILNNPKSLFPNVLRYTSCCVLSVIRTSRVVLVVPSLVLVIIGVINFLHDYVSLALFLACLSGNLP